MPPPKEYRVFARAMLRKFGSVLSHPSQVSMLPRLMLSAYQPYDSAGIDELTNYNLGLVRRVFSALQVPRNARDIQYI